VVGIKQNEKYDEKKVAERHRNHSCRPPSRPRKARIACVLVENGGLVLGGRADRRQMLTITAGKSPQRPRCRRRRRDGTVGAAVTDAALAVGLTVDA